MSLLLLLSPNDARPQTRSRVAYRPRRTRTAVWPPASGLALDGSSPPVARSFNASTDTVSFSPPAGLYVAFTIGDANTGAPDEQLNVTSTGGLIWSLVQRANGSPGTTVEVWKCRALTPPGSIVVSAADNKGNVAKSLLVQVITDLSGRGIPDTGAVAVSASGTVSYVSTMPGSWGWSVGIGSSNANNTPGAGQQLVDSVTGGAFDSGDNIWTINQQYLTQVVGTTVAMQVTSPPTVVHHVAVEIVPYLGLQPQTAGPRRCRPPLQRRTRQVTGPWPAAQAAQPPPFVAQPPRRLRLAAGQRRPHTTAAPVDQPSFSADTASRRRILPMLRRRQVLVAPADQLPVVARFRARLLPQIRRSRTVAVVPAQVAVAAPAYPPQSVRARIRGLRWARGRSAQPVPAQDAPPVVARTRLRGIRLGRGRSAQVVPAQVTVINPPYPLQAVRTRLRGMRLSRGRSAQVVPAQVVVTPPAYPPQTWRARLRGLRAVRGRATPVPVDRALPALSERARVKGIRPVRGRSAQQVPVQPQPPVQGRGRPARVAPRRPRTSNPPVAQALAPLFTRIRARLVRVFRGRRGQPVPPQVVLVPPVYVAGSRRTRRVLVLVARNRRTAWVSHACVTGRPGTGTTGRPNTGTTVYNRAGTTRPGTGTTARPNTGTTIDPC